jgi:peptidoglycan hydrolase-like protein with peptidoglycan-binding domain
LATSEPRTLYLANPLLTGRDVVALQELLAPYHPGPADGVYGPLTAAAVARAKWELGFPDDGSTTVAGPKLLALLRGEPLPPDLQARQAVRRHDAAKTVMLRRQIAAVARWGAANEPQIHYRQSRPIDGLHEPYKLPLYTDCSGFVTLCYAWAAADDPNGLDYSGQGYTGTLLQHMRHIARSAVQVGDLVVWGAPPGHHVAVAVEAGADPLLVSHGQEKGPLLIRLSTESKFQAPPVTWLSSLR